MFYTKEMETVSFIEGGGDDLHEVKRKCISNVIEDISPILQLILQLIESVILKGFEEYMNLKIRTITLKVLIKLSNET